MLTEEVAGADKVDLVLSHEARGQRAFTSPLESSQRRIASPSEVLTGLPNMSIRNRPSLLEALAPYESKSGTARPATDDELTKRAADSVPAIFSGAKERERARTDAKAISKI